jgi:hypothetical protein
MPAVHERRLTRSDGRTVAWVERGVRDGQPILLTLAGMWSTPTPELSAVARKHSRGRRRKVVTDAVSAVLAV